MPVDRDHAPDRPATGLPDADTVRPPRVVLGVGASRGCPPAELLALADAALAEAGRSRRSVVAVASADVKADEPAIVALAAALGVPARFLPAAALAAVDVPTPSAVVAAHVGTPSVAEAAALLIARAAAGPAPSGAASAPGDGPPLARLLVPKRRSAHATCAIAAVGPSPVRDDRPSALSDPPAPAPTEVPLP